MDIVALLVPEVQLGLLWVPFVEVTEDKPGELVNIIWALGCCGNWPRHSWGDDAD